MAAGSTFESESVSQRKVGFLKGGQRMAALSFWPAMTDKSQRILRDHDAKRVAGRASPRVAEKGRRLAFHRSERAELESHGELPGDESNFSSRIRIGKLYPL